MKYALVTVLATFALGVSGQATIRKCHTSGLKSKVSEGKSIASAICQQVAGKPIAIGAQISACVPFHSDGTTDQTNYHWELTVRHSGEPSTVPPRFSDVNLCVAALNTILQGCGDGYLTQGGYGFVTNNIVEWEIDPNHEDSC